MDTRDLIEERETLQQTLLDEFNDRFSADLDYFEEIEEYDSEDFDPKELESFKEEFEHEFYTISEIDRLEREGIDDFNYGAYLIPEEGFVDYVQELLEDCGYISKDFPSWIEIDWDSTAENVKVDYMEVSYKGNTYLVR